jgi:hypothetical protein
MDPQCDVRVIGELMSKQKPGLVFIDGDYSINDDAKWTKIMKMSEVELKLYLLEKAATDGELPESYNLLCMVNAFRNSSTTIVIFVEDPSEPLKAELKRRGADFVWPSLNKLSNFESSFFSILNGTKEIFAGMEGVAKSFINTLTKPSKK